MAITASFNTEKQIQIEDVSSGEFIGNIYAPNIVSFTKLIRRAYKNDQGDVPDDSYVGTSGSPPSKEEYIVRLHLNNGMIEDIPLVAGGWSNDEAGYKQAVIDITTFANT
jgi:hypothetical protein